MEHHVRKIHNKKLFFIKSFIISVVLLIISYIAGIIGFDFFAGMADKYYNVDTEDYAKILVNACCIWKLLIIQFTLVPAIALGMLERHVKQEEMVD